MPVLISAGTLALSLTACGGGAAEEEPAEAAAESPEEGGGGSVLDLVARLGESTQSVDNYTLDISMVMPDPDMGDIDMDMTYEVMEDPQAAKVTMVMPSMGEMLLELTEMSGQDLGLTAEELGTSIVIIPAEGDALVSNHNGLQDVGTAWISGAQDTDQIAPEEMFDINALPDIVGAFAEIEQIEETGAEEISGVSTTLIEGTMTGEDVEALNQEQKDAVNELLGGVSGPVDVSVWVADDGFPMRLDFSDEEADISMVFSNLGETSFEMPAEDEITVM
jgi:hypothetical protein